MNEPGPTQESTLGLQWLGTLLVLLPGHSFRPPLWTTCQQPSVRCSWDSSLHLLSFYMLSLSHLISFVFSCPLHSKFQAQISKCLLVIFLLHLISASKPTFLTLNFQSHPPDLLLLISHLVSSTLSPKLVWVKWGLGPYVWAPMWN